MKQLAALIITVLIATSCKKQEEDNRAFSTWYINGEKFSSQNTQLGGNYKNVTTLDCLDGDSQGIGLFGFMFVDGITRMSCYPKQGFSNCGFSYHNKLYVAPYDTFFYVRFTGASKLQVTIDSAWVYQLSDNTHQKLDSVLVWGAFNEP